MKKYLYAYYFLVFFSVGFCQMAVAQTTYYQASVYFISLSVKFIACGQSMGFQSITKDQLAPWMKIALSAQIPISTYQLKGFVYKKIETE
jgi:intracellular sulfur oxidation DsrE/DsrF family protein